MRNQDDRSKAAKVIDKDTVFHKSDSASGIITKVYEIAAKHTNQKSTLALMGIIAS
jgi:hypothetical protein